MDGISLLRMNLAHLVNGLAQDIEDPAEGLFADGHGDRPPEADRLHAAHESIGGLHGDGAHAALADVLLCFADDVDRLRHVVALADDADRGVNFGDLAFGKLAVDGGAGDLNYVANGFGSGCHKSLFLNRSLAVAAP